MFYEPSALASLTGLLATTLRQDYDLDPEPIFFRAGIPVMPKGTPRLRYPLSTTRKLWDISKEVTGDETIGLRAGRYAQPAMFYAFGYSWLARSTLLGGLQRLERYYKLVTTASAIITLTELKDSYALSAEFPEVSKAPPKEGIDCGMTALLALCDIVADAPVRPVRVRLTCPATVHPEAYRQALRAPIEFNAPVGTIYFARDVLLSPLRHGTPDIAKATNRIAEEYIESLDPHQVASQVRRLLIALLPSGKADQDMESRRLNRSASTLQRQPAEEGLTYREVLDSTRRSLAEDYLADGKHSQAQIAHMFGFSDQSNFSRAFIRWTRMSPKKYQESQAR